MPSTPHGAHSSSSATSHHHVNSIGHLESASSTSASASASASRASAALPSKPTMASNNANGHYRAPSPSSALSPDHALDKSKRMVTSPHKLMMGVPPASTPTLSSSSVSNTTTNGTFIHHHNDTHHSNGATNGTIPPDTKGKQKQLDPIQNIPLAQLEQELPLEESDLVSLAALVERLANYGYESLQNLAETLPSLPSSSKRAKIFTTALDVRKQFIKLLVLSRWSKDVSDLQKSRNIIALLSEQQWQHEDVFAGLTDIRKILPNARMRNADLPTAIDVLQTGTYRRLPTSIKHMAVAPKPFTDEQALAIVSRLEDALRTRMACREVVPAPLSDYSIRDGKVHLHVHGLFEAQLTASSGGLDHDADAHIQALLSNADAASTSDPAASAQANADDRWWLLDLRFDVIPTGSCAASSSKAYPSKPKRAYRERLRIWGDQELAPKSLTQLSEAKAQASEAATEPAESVAHTNDANDEPLDASAAKQDSEEPVATKHNESTAGKASTERDAPLSRLFAFLQERSLHYQMDILQHQAYQLCRLNWGSNLRIETAERPRRLTVHYWTHAQGAAGEARIVDSLAAGGRIQISLVDLPDHAGATKTLAKLFDDDLNDDNATQTEGQTSLMTVKRRGLKVTWEAHASILADSETSDLVISPHSLDIEALLSLVIKRHTLALLRSLQRGILVSDHPVSRLLRPEDCTLCTEHVQRQGDEFSTATEATSFSFLQLELHGSNRPRAGRSKHASLSTMPPLRLGVDAVTGRLSLDSELARVTTESGSHASPQPAASFTASILTTRPTQARLAEASDRINGSVEALFDVLYRLEVFARVQDWERMASYLGLRSVRKLNLRPQDLAKFGPSASPEAAPQLFIPLRNSFPGYFLALQPSELAGASIALVYVVQMMDPTGAPSLTVQSIEWLDRAKIASASSAGRDAHGGVAGSTPEIGQKRKAAPSVGSTSTEVQANLGKQELTMEELAQVHSYCIALVSYFRVEQQLRMRGIPYLHVGSTTSRSAPPTKWPRRIAPASAGTQADVRDNGLFDDEDVVDAAAAGAAGTGVDATRENDEDEVHQQAGDSGMAALVPSLCLRATDLLGPAKAHLTKPNISLRVRNWNDSETACVQMLIKLRMKSRRFRALHEVVTLATNADQHSTSPSTWIDFDDETSLLTLSTRDLDNCIPIFYAQWERVMRMVQLTREVLNASRAWQLQALRARISCKKPHEVVELRCFHFDMVIFSYGTISVEEGKEERKLLVRVRWQDAKMEMTPYNAMPMAQSGGYVLEFGSIPTAQLETLDKAAGDARLSPGATAAAEAASKDDAVSQWFDNAHAALNPHNTMAFELRRTVNVAARSAALSVLAQPHLERRVWRGFFQLLRDTLPLVRALAPLASQCLTDPDVPELEIRGATWFRLRFHDRYALDLRLATRSRLVVADAARPLFRSDETRDEDTSELFAGSELLNRLVEGKPPAAVESKRSKVRPTQPSAASQFQPIPNIEGVLRDLHAAHSGTGTQAEQVWDLRRALLVSLGGGSGLHTLLPQLIARVAAQLGEGAPSDA